MLTKPLSILILSSLPVLGFAAANHAHDDHGADHHMSSMSDHSSYGQPGKTNEVSREIKVRMDDQMRFTPNNIDVKAGETIRFVIINEGKIPHEMVLGTLAELKAHAAEMLAMPDMPAHAEPNMLTLDAGQRGELIWTFSDTAKVDFACLIPGHSEAGMIGEIHIKASSL